VGALKGVGDVKFAVTAGIISMWGNGVLWTFIFGIVFNMGVVGAWLGMAMDEWIRGIVMQFRWRSMVWKKHTAGKRKLKNSA
jgi:Na+-driven multidrug efflux pump